MKPDNLSVLDKDKLLDALWVSKHSDVYDHKIVNIEKFILSPYYLNMKGQIWNSVIKDLIEFYNSGKKEFIDYETIGGGKSFKSSIIACFEVYKILCLKNPQSYYGLANDSKITVLNMSITGKQARNIVFSEIWNRLDNSYWFQNFYKPNQDKRSEIEFKQKNIYIIPGNSKESTPLGYALIVSIMDEVAFYYDDEHREQAENIYTAMKRRIFSRFGNDGKIVLISQANYKDDFMNRHIEKQKSLNEAFIVTGKTLWEARPELFKLGFVVLDGYNIPIELEKDYKHNPDKFKRDFMAIPSETIEPYIKMFTMVKDSCWGLTNPVKDNIIDLAELKKRLDYNSRYIHIDLGLKKDACGLCMCHKKDEKVILDLALRITKAPEIDFSEVREIVIQIKNIGYNIQKITFDGWQSIDSRQILTKYGFNVEILSVDRTLEPYDTLKQLFYDRKIVLLNSTEETMQYLLYELQNLELYQNKKVDHSPKSSKDISDALCGASYNAILDNVNINKSQFTEFKNVFNNNRDSKINEIMVELGYEQ